MEFTLYMRGDNSSSIAEAGRVRKTEDQESLYNIRCHNPGQTHVSQVARFTHQEILILTDKVADSNQDENEGKDQYRKDAAPGLNAHLAKVVVWLHGLGLD